MAKDVSTNVVLYRGPETMASRQDVHHSVALRLLPGFQLVATADVGNDDHVLVQEMRTISRPACLTKKNKNQDGSLFCVVRFQED